MSGTEGATPEFGGRGGEGGAAPWRRRRRIVRWRRFWDASTSWLLGLLVVISVVLAIALWSGAFWSNLPLASIGSSPYVAANSTAAGNVDLALMPEWMVVLYPGHGGDIALGEASMTVVWDAVRATLVGLRAAQFAVGSKVAYKTLVAQEAALPGGTAGLEIYLGSPVRWSSWDRALGGPAAWTGADPLFDRLAILPGKSAPACAAPAAAQQGTAVADLFTGADTGLQVDLNPQAYCGLLGVLQTQQGGGYPLAPLASAASNLPVAPGVLAPTTFAWQPVRLAVEGLDARRLAAAIFPDPLSVIVRPSPNGGSEFTDAENWALTVTAGGAQLVVPPPQHPAAAAPWDVGLQEAVNYVSLRGGWPLTAWLAQSQAQCSLTKCGSAYEYLFSTRYDNLPVLPTTGAAAAITVRLVGGSGQPVLYGRSVPVPGDPIAGFDQSPISAAAAVAAIAATPPASLLGVPAQVLYALPAWVPLQGELEPAWAVGVEVGNQGDETVLVDAYRGSVLGTWPPP